jgi:hypothetical protein
MSSIQLDVRLVRMLLADWFARLARETGLPLTQYGSSGDSFTIGSPTDLHIIAAFVPEAPYLRFKSSDPTKQRTVDAIAGSAVERLKAGDYGGNAWHSTACAASDWQLKSPFSMGSLIERLSNQTRILGWRRLGQNVLLEFTEELPENWDEKNALFAPKAVVHIHVCAPGPCSGHFSSHVAHEAVEAAAAICTFALGRDVAFPPSAFPSRPDGLAELGAKRSDPSILTLARKGVDLDIFSPLSVPGGYDYFQRLRAALLTFHAGVQQELDAVACILYVASAEALTTPNAKWRDKKLTKRFVEYFNELMPDELDTIIKHDNFEAVFGIRRGQRTNKALRRDVLSAIYGYRSGHLHSGLKPAYQGFASGSDGAESVRRALFADFSEGAILRYISLPRSSLIGHPGIVNTE